MVEEGVVKEWYPRSSVQGCVDVYIVCVSGCLVNPTLLLLLLLLLLLIVGGPKAWCIGLFVIGVVGVVVVVAPVRRGAAATTG